MKKGFGFTIVTTALLLAGCIVRAQSWQWAAAGQGGSEGICVAADFFGNSYVAGNNQSPTITFGTVTLTIPGSGSTGSAVVAKFDPAGNFLWVRSTTAGNAGPSSLTTDMAGNLYIAGYYTTPTVSFGATTLTNPYYPGVELFLVKYTPAGTLALAMNVASTNYAGGLYHTAVQMQVKGGNLYLAGSFSPAVLHIGPYTLPNNGPGGSTSDVFITKLDTLGNFAWAKSFGGASLEEAFSMAVTKNDNIYVGGVFWSPTISFGTASIANTGTRSMFLAKYDATGNPLWARSIGGQREEFEAVVTDSTEAAYITGSYNYPVTFGTITITNPSPGTNLQYLFLAKYDASGNAIWAKSIAESTLFCFASGAVTDLCGNIWVSGSMGPNTPGSVTIDGHVLPPPAGSADPWFMAQFSPSGTYLGGTAMQTGGDDISGLAIDGHGNIFFGGDYYKTTFTLGSTTLHDPTTHSENMMVAKYGNASFDTTFSHKDTCVSGPLVLNAPVGYFYYKWSDGSAGQTITVHTSGSYWAVAAGGCGGSVVIDTFRVTEGTTDTLHHNSDTTICSAPNLVLDAQSGYLSYTWSDGSNAQSLTASTAGTFWVICKGTCTQATLIDTFKVSVNNRDLSFFLGNDTSACAPVQLQVPILNVNYHWQDGSGNSSTIATHSGTYTATVSDHGCTYADSIKVTLVDVSQNLNDTILCREKPIDLTLQANVPSNGTALWSNGNTQSSIIVTDTGSYWVTVSAAGCVASDTMRLQTELCFCQAALPVAFTPNGDNKNDEFYPYIDPGCNITSYSFSIYNRWGQRVFHTTDFSEKWDGKLNGVPAELGTYMYYLDYKAGLNNTRHFIKGDVTLVR